MAFATTPVCIILSGPRASKPKEKKCIQNTILPFGENSHIIHGDMQRIMNTRGRVDHYNGFSNPSALIPSGREDHHNWFSLETLQRAQVFLVKKKKNSCNSSGPNGQSTVLLHTQEIENKIEASGPLQWGESVYSSHATGFNSLRWELHWLLKGPGREEFTI